MRLCLLLMGVLLLLLLAGMLDWHHKLLLLRRRKLLLLLLGLLNPVSHCNTNHVWILVVSDEQHGINKNIERRAFHLHFVDVCTEVVR